MKSKALFVLFFISALALTGCGAKKLTLNEEPNNNQGTTEVGKLTFNYDYTDAEGECKSLSDCHKVETCERIICTNQPDHYQADSCEVNIDKQPSADRLDRQDYNCGCVPNDYKCGWLKK